MGPEPSARAPLRPRRAAAPGNRLRSLDALHLAAAQELGQALIAFVVYDKRLVESAQSLGLPVESPGAA
ncbi:hypothetical protein OG609_17190 [Streptomyces sp. NBC_01224]|uniref:hypothetical protein n=1 Tax=Streptomyces sp. NBC_01224 TaxID=2903783 RepID=UPI002E150723|nr:hypothetical protein OG609_17190 [Streptomyces sp. NBC_01224]